MVNPLLFVRLGGATAVNAAVDIFYDKVMADTTLAPFFEGVDMVKQRSKQKLFLTSAFGGSIRYEGNDLRASHSHLVQRGLNDSHFNNVAKHLQSTLSQLCVDTELANEVMEIVESTRHEVLGK